MNMHEIMQSRRYRIEHQNDGVVALLGYMNLARAHHSTLEPFLSRLLTEGATGSAYLIDDETDTVVASRHIQSFEPGRQRRFGGAKGPRDPK